MRDYIKEYLLELCCSYTVISVAGAIINMIVGSNTNNANVILMFVFCAIAVFVLLTVFTGRAKRARKGYAVGPLGPELIKKAIIAALKNEDKAKSLEGIAHLIQGETLRIK